MVWWLLIDIALCVEQLLCLLMNNGKRGSEGTIATIWYHYSCSHAKVTKINWTKNHPAGWKLSNNPCCLLAHWLTAEGNVRLSFSSINHAMGLNLGLYFCTDFYAYLSDPGEPGVRSMGPGVSNWVHPRGLLRLNWCDSGWWRSQLNALGQFKAMWQCKLTGL